MKYWTPTEDATIKIGIAAELSMRQIALALPNRTRNMVIGRAYRLRAGSRPWPHPVEWYAERYAGPIQRYLSGATADDAAAGVCGRETLLAAMVRLGIPMRRYTPRPKKTIEERRAEPRMKRIIEMRTANITLKEIGTELGISRARVWQLLKAVA